MSEQLSKGRPTPYSEIYRIMPRGMLANRWYSFTSVNGKPITRADVNKIRSNITHSSKRGLFGGWRMETQQGMDTKTGLYTFKVRKVRGEKPE